MATLPILAGTLALGATLVLPARADNTYPPVGSGGIQVSPVINGTPVVVGSNATINFSGLQAPYMIQVSSNSTDWMNGGVTSLQFPNFSGTCVATNVPPGSAFFRLMMLGSPTWVGKWNPGALAVSNVFVGGSKCVGCHTETVNDWSGTAHARAVNAILNPDGTFKPGRDDSCLVCHVVGKGQPGGYVNLTNTAHLANVQCENCHGSANAHINISGRLYYPINTKNPALCGACHTGANHPTYDEYITTRHAQVIDDVKYGFANGLYYTNILVTPSNTWYGYYVTTNANGSLQTNATTGIIHSFYGPANNPVYDQGQDRAVSCGICHSAAARLVMLKDYELRQTGLTNPLAMPVAAEAAGWSATCVSCHDPHSTNNVAQLRAPLSSTIYYTMATTSDKRTDFSTNVLGQPTTNIYFMSAAFANMYNPNVQVCGQCHNSRGSRWDGRGFGYFNSNTLVSATAPGPGIVWGLQTNISYARAPHHSPQYNILIGIVQPDYLGGTNIFGPHSRFSKGCATCHMTTRSVNTPTDEDPNYTGHQFEPLLSDFASCTGCHGDAITASNKMARLQAEVSSGLNSLVAQLNTWAILKGTNTFGAVNAGKYQQNGWEYTAPGPYATATNTGPSAADQLKIPEGVRQARFNLYMVGFGNAASLGVHNPTFTRFLLNDSSNKVAAAIAAP